ncbi:hypothetical protein [Paenibacillus polysaccharolyticus]|uniref:hypothetical protein n=1 Tax=Paenibacillus polysaccharolyticus TaxID=582692 RepID=UPI00300804C7
MFWKKKKKILENSVEYVGLLFAQSIEISDRFYQKLLNEIPQHNLVKDKENHWYFYFSVAAVMTGLLELEDEYEENYIQVIEILDNWDKQGVEASQDFNNYLRNSPLLAQGVDNLYLIITQWLYFNVKESTDIDNKEIDPFLNAGEAIAELFYGWFSKNGIN